MSLGERVTEFTGTLATLYRDVLTTTARFDMQSSQTREALDRMERAMADLTAKVTQIHDEHVREKAALDARIQTLDGRLTTLSEQALHAVARDAARDIMRQIGDGR
jgi:hypothetical protein